MCSLLVSFNLMFIVLITTAHEESGGGQDGGCVDEVTQQALSKYMLTCWYTSIMNIINS